MKKKEWIPIGLAFAALLVGTIYDYTITDALYQAFPITSMMFERFFLLPIQLAVVITMAMLFRVKGNGIYLLSGYLASVYLLQDALHYWMPLSSSIIWIALCLSGALLTALIQLCIYHLSLAWIQTHINVFVFYTVVLVTAVCLTSLIKVFWGRIRYRDMSDAAQFCVWYKPCGLSGNHSFPSGHTTAWTSLLCLLQWKKNPYEKPSALRYTIITALIVWMPITRMMMGAHFLSDTAMGFLITYSCYLYGRGWFRRRGML